MSKPLEILIAVVVVVLIGLGLISYSNGTFTSSVTDKITDQVTSITSSGD